MASHSYPEPHNCFDTMQNFFQNIFGGGRDNNENANDTNTNTNGNGNGNGNDNGNGDNASSTAGRASRFGRSQPRQARGGGAAAAASSRQSSGSESTRPREAAAPSSASASASASSSQQRTRPRPAAESEGQGTGTGASASAGAQEGRHNLSPFEFLAEAFGHGLTREQFYAAAQQAAQEAGLGNPNGQQQGHQGPQPNPPASCKSIRQLPTVIVKPEDLVDENNRECCICFEPLNIGERATRLPCAHIYHPRCVIQWLGSHSNTCPVCRYELPTENDTFERGREERMKRRKPRYAPYELYRMNIKDLKELCQKIALDPKDYMEKKEMVRAILESGRVEVITAPEPVEYPCIGALRSMGIRQLKNAMADAGVFFDPKDVVEKEDMVQIFVSSGRIILEEEEGNGDDDVDDDDGDKKMSSNNSNTATDYDYGHAPRNESDIKRARLSSNDLDTYEYSTTSMKENETLDDVASSAAALNVSQGEGSIMSITATGSGSESDPLLQDQDAEEDESSMNCNEQQQQQQHREPLTPAPSMATTASATTSNVHNSPYTASTSTSTSAPEASTGITTRSVKELRRLAQELNVDISGCLEKREMVDLITANLGNNR